MNVIARQNKINIHTGILLVNCIVLDDRGRSSIHGERFKETKIGFIFHCLFAMYLAFCQVVIFHVFSNHSLNHDFICPLTFTLGEEGNKGRTVIIYITKSVRHDEQYSLCV